MATRTGVKEFRDKFASIARDAKEPVVVTDHDTVIGYYTPADHHPAVARDWTEFDKMAASARRSLEARGVDVRGRLKALGVEDDAEHEA